MSIAQGLLPEFDHEMANTRKTLERIPEDKLEWKPDPKSMSLGRLAGHIAEMPGWSAMTLTTDSMNMVPGQYPPMVATSREQVVGGIRQERSFRARSTGVRDGREPYSSLGR